MNKYIILKLSSVFWLIPLFLWAQMPPQKTTLTYIQQQDVELKLDIYQIPEIAEEARPCIIFVFGGGFKEGTRDAETYKKFFDYFSRKGYITVAIDYRLGLKNIDKAPSAFNQEPLDNAIHLAVEDLYWATSYLLKNAEKYNIDPSKIIICGSSAGAITVLQADYEKCNTAALSKILPETFRYAGVISFAGAIYSTEGTPKYAVEPAPTLFFHGSGDRLVPYHRIRLFNKGMFGSKSLAAKFKKSNYPYCFFSMEGIGHEVAEYPMTDYLPEIERFIQTFIINGKRLYIDVNVEDEARKPTITVSPKDYYK